MTTRRIGLTALLLSGALAVAGCGGDDAGDLVLGNTGPSNGGDGGNGSGNGGGGAATGDFFDLGGFLLNQDIHPLQDNIDPAGGDAANMMITPAPPVADQQSCPDGTVDPDPSSVNSVVLFDDGDFFEGGPDNPEFPVCIIDSNFTGDGKTYTLTNNHVYLLLTAALVGNGGIEDRPRSEAANVTLNIEPGTQIYGQAGEKASLRATRGSTININGNADRPVLMAAVEATNTNITGDPTDLTGRGDWGGLVVDGYAETNGTDAGDGGDGSNDVPNELLSEAAPSGQTNVHFGGGDNADSSGSITYLVIGESGVTFRPDAELQGLTLEGVGSNTTIENLQIFGSNDDGIEWFGGTVNVSDVVINGEDDDGLDIDQGYTGVIKKAIVRQGSQVGDRTSEADGNGSGFDRTPVTRPVLANVLLLGAGDADSLGLRMREGYGADFENAAVADTGVVTTVSDSLAFGRGCFNNTDEVDRDLTARGIAFFCANSGPNGAASDGSPLYTNVWSQGQYDEDGGGTDTGTGTNPVGFNAMEDDTISVDGNSYVVTTAMQPFGDVNHADPYVGAVDPDNAGGNEYWRGWTVHISNRQ